METTHRTAETRRDARRYTVAVLVREGYRPTEIGQPRAWEEDPACVEVDFATACGIVSSMIVWRPEPGSYGSEATIFGVYGEW